MGGTMNPPTNESLQISNREMPDARGERGPSRGLGPAGSRLRDLAKAWLPSRTLEWYRARHTYTVGEGWEQWARSYGTKARQQKPGSFMGDEWTVPEQMGVDAPAAEVVDRLDRLVFQPFLGHVDTAL